jgi:hypothetical protein
MQQYNLLRFFTDKRSRQWEKTPEDGSSFVFYPTGTIPSFSVNFNSSINDPAPTISAALYDFNDNLIISLPAYNGYEGLGSSVKDTYTQVLYTGSILSNQEENNCYLKLTINSTDYFSDVFVWKDDVSTLLKIDVSSSDIRVGETLINMMQGATSTFYINAEYLGIKPKIEQEGVNNNGITDVIFGSRTITREFQVDVNESIFMYLSALALLKSNGSISITWNYQTWIVSEILIEEVENHLEGLYQVRLSVIDENETISMSNG